jgi:hypothetical protein
MPIQRPINVSQRIKKRLVRMLDAIAQLPICERQQQRPLTESRCQFAQFVFVSRRQAIADQFGRFVRLHRVHLCVFGVCRQCVKNARGDQSGAARSALHERFQMRPVPHVVDHDQDVAISQQFDQARHRHVNARELRLRFIERLDQILDAPDEVAGIFAKRHPQNTIVKGFLDGLVMTKCPGQGCFAVPAGAAQRCGDRDRFLALFVKKPRTESVEFCGARHKMLGQVLDHERHA